MRVFDIMQCSNTGSRICMRQDGTNLRFSHLYIPKVDDNGNNDDGRVLHGFHEKQEFSKHSTAMCGY
jgi:hypothetical protein